MLNQSFRQVFVTNTPVLLPEGQTVDALAVGQVAILDAASYKATIAPTYGKNKALYLAWGQPDLPQSILGGPNQNEYTHLIKGKLVKNFRGKKASRCQNQVVTVGFSGDVSDTDTLFAKPGQQYELFLNLTGDAITKEYSQQGIQRRYYFKKDVVDDCVDTCVDVDPREIAQFLAKQINGDKTINRYVKALINEDCTPDLPTPTTVTNYVFRLIVADTKDNYALGLVQAQYPGYGVKRVGEDGITSIYEVVRTANTTPAAYSNAGNVVIPECDTCPAGYTYINTGYAYRVTRDDAGDAAALAAVGTEFGIDNTERISRVAYDYGQSTYILASDTAITPVNDTNEIQSIVATGASAGTFTLSFDGETTAPIAYNANAATVAAALAALSNLSADDVTAAGGSLPTTPVTVTFKGARAGTNVPALVADNTSLTGGSAVVTTSTPGVDGTDGLESLGEVRQSCVITSPTTIAWAADGTKTRYAKAYRLTLADDVCGNDRLTDVQAAYPDNVVTLVDAAGDCVHTYEITVYSQLVEDGCGIDPLSFTKPGKFEGAEWRAVADAATPDGTTCKTGLRLEVGVVNRKTNEVTFHAFPYEADTVYLEVSSGNADYNSNVPLENIWSVKQIQGVKFPQGSGAYIRKLEQDSLSYALKFRSNDPVIRELEAYEFQAKGDLFYDEYVLEFDFSYMVGGYAQRYTDAYSLFVYFPEGQGKAFETAINTYIASANINIDPVVL